MRWPKYSALVGALLVYPLFLAVGCSASAGGECSVEGDKFCSGVGNEILICSRSDEDELRLTTHMPCTDGTICEVCAEGPECVSGGCPGGSGGTGGTGGTSGTGGSAGSGGSVGNEYCATYDLFSSDCFPAPEFREDVTLDFSGSTMAYIMTVGGLPETNDATDFTVGAAGTWNDTTGTGTGTGDFVVGEESNNCDAPQARLRFDIQFDETLPNYTGMINFDFTLDANCGSSICFASAEVTGTQGACPP